MAANQWSGKVPGAFCGSHGSCGAAIGTGMFISTIIKPYVYEVDPATATSTLGQLIGNQFQGLYADWSVQMLCNEEIF
ncbi:DUF5714 domain-containing protein [Mariniphaga sediminis]|jgi:hypothetical protein|uniref:DUF5714 domain-containing protein n=1 Tax=Mariniphaga sediminis TaxID=1628158 RepID=UPI00374417C1